MVSHICLLVELGPICNSTAASLCLKSCVDHSLLKSYNGSLWKNIYRSGPKCPVFLFTDNNRQQPTTNLQLPTTTVNDPDQPTTSVVWLNILFIMSTKNSSGMYFNDHIDLY